jgi:hypothetical protein
VVFGMALGCAIAFARGEDRLHVDGRRPVRVVLSTRAVLDRSSLIDAPMARTINGVLADLDRRRVGAFVRCAGRGESPLPLPGAEPLCYAHLFGAETVRTLRVVRTSSAAVDAAIPPDGDGAPIPIDHAALRALWDDDRPYVGPLEWTVDLAPLGRSFELSQPYEASGIVMDRSTMKRRLYRGINVLVEDADRDLATETMRVRLPREYDPRRPAGLLVWASPTPDGSVPAVLDDALDALDMVCIGVDDAGNDRDVPDKFQLYFDAVATASRRFHIAPGRVYIAGMSGGGKVSSILCICFPEIFAGAIPIVGLATYTRLEPDWGDHHQPYFAAPRGPALRQAHARPIAPISGPSDYNYAEMRARFERLEEDGFERLRFFEDPEMGHAMPGPGLLAEALRYVDEPWQVARAQALAGARQQLDGIGPAGEESPAGEHREALLQVVRSAPWSEPGWEALRRLCGRVQE